MVVLDDWLLGGEETLCSRAVLLSICVLLESVVDADVSV